MSLWVVRAGKRGEYEADALDRNVVGVNFSIGREVASLSNREAVEQVVRAQHPDATAMQVRMWTGQLVAVRDSMAPGDLVALPLKNQPAIALGEIAGPYRFDPATPGMQHQRPVRWLRKDVPRSAFDQDILHSFGSLLTAFQVSRNDAERRVRALAQGAESTPSAPDSVVDEAAAVAEIDVAQIARDNIREFIGRRFHGHGLAYLVSEVLRAQGYEVFLSPPGPDGGVDILAGRGAMGFEGVRLAVQVKSGATPADVRIVRELKGVLHDFGATHGLLVSWAGFNTAVKRERSAEFFKIRLWDADDVIGAVQDCYERLPETLRAELPLKRIWTLVEEEA